MCLEVQAYAYQKPTHWILLLPPSHNSTTTCVWSMYLCIDVYLSQFAVLRAKSLPNHNRIQLCYCPTTGSTNSPVLFGTQHTCMTRGWTEVKQKLGHRCVCVCARAGERGREGKPCVDVWRRWARMRPCLVVAGVSSFSRQWKGRLGDDACDGLRSLFRSLE